MNRLLTILFFLGFISTLHADWGYKYLTLDELMAESSVIAVAEIETIHESIKEGRVTQEIVFKPLTILKGAPDPKGFSYHASYIPNLCAAPESHYISSPPGTKFLLFLKKKDNAYISVLGPCGALRVNTYASEQVSWYTNDSKAQSFTDDWKKKPLKEVIGRIKEKARQGTGGKSEKAR